MLDFSLYKVGKTTCWSVSLSIMARLHPLLWVIAVNVCFFTQTSAILSSENSNNFSLSQTVAFFSFHSQIDLQKYVYEQESISVLTSEVPINKIQRDLDLLNDRMSEL